jgi:hypothetical protein
MKIRRIIGWAIIVLFVCWRVRQATDGQPWWMFFSMLLLVILMLALALGVAWLIR